MKHKIVVILFFFFTLTSVVFAVTARNEPYDSYKSVSYINKWVSNSSSLRNSSYNSFSSDCTNFASQALRAGGWRDTATTDSKSDKYWYHSSKTKYSLTWSVADSLYRRITNGYEGWNGYTGTPWSANYGDIVFARWYSGQPVAHTAIVTGFIYNPYAGVYEPTLSYHSTDRKNIPMSVFVKMVKDNYGSDVTFYRFAKLNYCAIIQSNQIVTSDWSPVAR